MREKEYKLGENVTREGVGDGIGESIIDGLGKKWRLEEIDLSEMGVGNIGYVDNWRKSISESVVNEDVEGMKRKAAPLAQLRVLEIAMESQDERVALEANKFILSQSGHGAINRVEHSMQYNGMPTDQLAAMVKSAMQRIGKHNPALLARLSATSPQIIDATIVENDAPQSENDADSFHKRSECNEGDSPNVHDPLYEREVE